MVSRALHSVALLLKMQAQNANEAGSLFVATDSWSDPTDRQTGRQEARANSDIGTHKNIQTT